MNTSRETGMGKLTFLVFATLLLSFLYSAFQIMPFFYYYYEFKNHVDSTCKVAREYTDGEIRFKLTQRIKELGIPAAPEALVINRFENSIRVVLNYQEEFYIRFKGKDHIIHTFPFKIDETTKY